MTNVWSGPEMSAHRRGCGEGGGQQYSHLAQLPCMWVQAYSHWASSSNWNIITALSQYQPEADVNQETQERSQQTHKHIRITDNMAIL